jgi:hypothetical protein
MPALNSMLQTAESPDDVQALAARLPGKVVLPDDEGWGSAREACPRPRSRRCTYFNFAESPCEGDRMFGELTYQRLRRIKGQVDPDT